MDETLKKINGLLKKFNSTFDIEPNIVEDDNESYVNGLKIKNTKNDGAEFINEIFDMFNTVVQTVVGDYEVVYDKNRGLAIAKKVITVNYIFEDEQTQHVDKIVKSIDKESTKEPIEEKIELVEPNEQVEIVEEKNESNEEIK